MACLCDQREIRRNRIVVRSTGGDVIREGRREVVGRRARTHGVLTGVRISARNLEASCDRLNFGVAVAQSGEVTESGVLERVAGRADFLVNLEAALKLLVVELAERAV